MHVRGNEQNPAQLSLKVGRHISEKNEIIRLYIIKDVSSKVLVKIRFY